MNRYTPVVGIKISLLGKVPPTTLMSPSVRSEYVIATASVVPADCVVLLMNDPYNGATPGPVHWTAATFPTPGTYRNRIEPRGAVDIILI
jgi:hypothetical protein